MLHLFENSTFCTLVTSVILFQGFDADTMAIITVVLGFLVICAGITILQISKVDPEELSEKVSSVDRSSTLLLAASRSKIHSEKGHTEEEEPSVDALRGIAGIAGSIQRARSARRSMQSQSGIFDEHGQRRRSGAATHRGSQGLPRHQLYDLPASSRLHESKQQQHQHELQQHPLPDDFADKISLHSNRTGRSDSARSPQHTRPSPHIHFASASQNRMYPPGDPGQDSNAGAVYEEEDIPMSYMPTLAEEYEGGTGYRDPYARSAQVRSFWFEPRSLFDDLKKEGFSVFGFRLFRAWRADARPCSLTQRASDTGTWRPHTKAVPSGPSSKRPQQLSTSSQIAHGWRRA